MMVDGKAIATKILTEISKEVGQLSRPPKLSAITCAPNFETQKYLQLKKAKAASVGIGLNVVELSQMATTAEVVASIKQVLKDSDGIVVQLPLPPQIDRDAVLRAVPVEKDPDGFLYGVTVNACLSPVVGAIDEISKFYNVDWAGKKVIVLGQGRLVGLPAAAYARSKSDMVQVFEIDTFDEKELKTADIIVSGIGRPHFITKKMVKPGVVIFDAGTSEDGGVLVGDVHTEVASVASLLTPVPGGIGPITIAYLLRNLLRLSSQ
ncbi:bifunctional 5,10-methylenetetrahydrofolate dehydrogenase/5,10-methenyltetrahydrofolate cyclohydrolase [Candidatus Kaiserbacteria bacterium]|nr:bifunctional 5,10-methylenetetrahydrofolate dehydrogenase/5,10-methenyltetrahydrofolate cyclohydrolase [Candidatus Kaiserbacteria bacterium]